MTARLRIAVSLMVCSLLVVASRQGAAQPSKHRKIRHGVGNCVFSNKVLMYRKDATYKLKRNFVAPEKVYARCYYAKKLKKYKHVGKLKSQMRGMGHRRPSYNRRLQFSPPRWYYAHTIRLTTKVGNSDQGRMDIIPSGSCDFKKRPRTGRCIDLEKEVRNLAKQEKASLPYTAKICVHIDFDVVNKRVPSRKNRLKLVDKRQFHTLAKGCFKYTVKK